MRSDENCSESRQRRWFPEVTPNTFRQFVGSCGEGHDEAALEVGNGASPGSVPCEDGFLVIRTGVFAGSGFCSAMINDAN
jgi:hypothetical protein